MCVGSAHTVLYFVLGVRDAHTDFDCVFGFDSAFDFDFYFDFDLLSPEHRLDFSPTSGALGRGLFEHVAAQQIVRVPQPRLLVKN